MVLYLYKCFAFYCKKFIIYIKNCFLYGKERRSLKLSFMSNIKKSICFAISFSRRHRGAMFLSILLSHSLSPSPIFLSPILSSLLVLQFFSYIVCDEAKAVLFFPCIQYLFYFYKLCHVSPVHFSASCIILAYHLFSTTSLHRTTYA